ncbi:penicillin binding protein PBP4B [Pseudoalteromonas ruthenica]|uniref:penicillin binding protein PBP4B n=1 Tax=Pseudoalteromonas ruthenica TaxID=151081 RepID=UPI0015D1C38B|nr:penicillin binding protein PBP4B [Pseudoalteromonas ruthenica]
MNFPYFDTPMRTYLLLLMCMASLSCVNHYPMKPSHNYSKRIKFLVMHYTAIDYQKSERVLVDEGGLSAHYLVPQSGDASYQRSELEVVQLVAEQDRAWHAGNSFWQDRSDLNDHSIGIEVVNVPRCAAAERTAKAAAGQEQKLCMYPDYDPQQVQLLIALSQDILARNPDIGPTQVVGHSDIAPGRKSDPGPRFPWYQLYKAGVGAWYKQADVEHYWQHFSTAAPTTALMQQALRDYGYGVDVSGQLDRKTVAVIKAFQAHFLPWQVHGQADGKTAAVLFALLHRYKPDKAQARFRDYQALNTAQPAPSKPLGHEQLLASYPAKALSSRKDVNNKYRFKAYQGRGEIIIDNVNAVAAELVVNGQTLNIAKPLTADTQYRYSLSKRTRTGVNSLHIKSVTPEDAQLHIRIPAPVLTQRPIPKRFEQVDALINAEIEQGFPGAVLAVVHQGELVKLSAYGEARKYHDGGEMMATPQPMQTDTLFDIASNTKMFATNLALMHLVSQGHLDVSLPVSFYLPEYRGQGRELRLVSDLLEHSAGYPAVVDFHRRDNQLGEQFYSISSDWTKQLIVQGVPFTAMRKQRHLYSDIDYMLLGLLVERISGMPLDAYVESRLYAPLGITSMMFNPLQKGVLAQQIAATEIQGNTRGGRVHFEGVRDYVLQGEVHDEKAFYSLAGVAGHAGLFADAKSLAQLCQLLLNRGTYGEKQLFTASVLDQFTKPSVSDESYGLGWRRAGNGARKWHFGPYASAQAYGHTGWTGTVTVIDPEYDLAIVLLTNARHSPVMGTEQQYQFVGKQFETGQYGSVVTRVYEAILGL